MSAAPAPQEEAQEETPEGAPVDVPSVTEASPAAPARVAVLVLGASDTDAVAADGVSEVLIGAVASRATAPLHIVGKEELQAALGHAEERSLECVSSPRCLGRLGVQLDLDEVIAGVVRSSEGGWRFDLNRVDGRSGENVGRTSGEVQGDLGALAGALLEALPELYAVAAPAEVVLRVTASVAGAEIRVDGTLIGRFEGEALAVPDLAPGTHTVEVQAEGHEPWRRELELVAGTERELDAGLTPIVLAPPPPPPPARGISSVLWVGVGVAALGGATTMAFGLRSRGQPAEGATRAEAVAFHQDRQRDATIANVGLGVAAAGVGLMVTGLLLSDFGDRDFAGEAPVDVALSPRGGTLQWSGRW